MEAPQATIFALLSLPSHSLHRWLLLQCLQITCDFLHLPTLEDPAKMNINSLLSVVMIEATVGLSEVDLTPRGTIESPPHNLNIKITSPIEESNTPNVQAKNNSIVIVEIQSTATLVKMIITTEVIKGTTIREKIIKITEGPTTTTGRVGRKAGRGIIREKIEIRGKRRDLQTDTTSDNLRIEINMTTESKEIIEIHMADKTRQLKEAGREEGLEAEIEEEDEEEGDLLPKSLPKSRRKNPKNNQWRWNKVRRKLRVKNQEKNNQGRHHRQEILSQHKQNHRVSRLKNQKVRNSKFNPNKEAR